MRVKTVYIACIALSNISHDNSQSDMLFKIALYQRYTLQIGLCTAASVALTTIHLYMYFVLKLVQGFVDQTV